MKFRNAIFLLPLSALIFAGTAPAALPTDVFDDPLLSSQWQWTPPGETASQGIRIADAWAAGITGKGVVIGILGRDWISQTHEDLNISAYNPSTDWTTADLSQGLSYDFSSLKRFVLNWLHYSRHIPCCQPGVANFYELSFMVC